MNKTSDLPLHLFQVLEQEYHYLYGPLPDKPETVYLPDPENFDRSICDPSAAPAGEPPASPPLESPPAEGVESPPAEGCGWREVEAARDWEFRRGHIKDPVMLAAALLPQQAEAFGKLPADLAQRLASYDWSRDNLKRYINWEEKEKREQPPPAEPRAPRADGERSEPPGALAARLEKELNRLLADPELYHPDRFAGSWVSQESRNLIALRKSLRGSKRNDAIRHLRLREAYRLARSGDETAESFADADDLKHFNRLLLEDAFPELEKIFDVRFAAACQRLHKVKPTALSLSGGGIRSGTFALGLLQGLARHDLLKGFDYLSTVSGGGYIGGWLTAWLHRHPDGLEGVTRELANCPPVGKVDPDPPPLRHLRGFSNFITPKVGLLTADTWTFVGIYFRNLLINWMVFVPLILAALLVPRLVLTATLAQPVGPAATEQVFALHGRHVFLALGFLLGVWALAYIDFNRPGLRDKLRQRSRFWRHRSDQRSFLKWCLTPLLFSALFLTTYFAWSSEHYDKAKDGPALPAFGLLFIAGGWGISSVVVRRWRGDENARGAAPSAASAKKGLSRYWIVAALFLTGALAGLIFFAISRGTLGTPVINYDSGFDFSTYGWWWRWTTELYVCFAVPVFLLVFWGGTTFFVGVSSVSSAVSDEDREWWSRLGAWLIIAAFVWAAGASLVIFGPVLLLSSPKLLAGVGGAAGLFALLAGRSAKTPGHKKNEAEGGAGAAVMGKLLPLLAVVFLAACAAALSLATSYLISALAVGGQKLILAWPRPPSWLNWLSLPRPQPTLAEWFTNAPSFEYHRWLTAPPDMGNEPWKSDPYRAYTSAKLFHLNALHHTSVWFTLGLGVALGLVGGGLSYLVNLNIFSLHGGYRNRLIRGFLGASRPAGEREPNPFTGFDPDDNVAMHALRPGRLDEDDILKAVELKRHLLDTDAPDAHVPLAARLAPYLDQTRDAPDRDDSELRRALQIDLNRALDEESLYAEFGTEFMRTRRARDIRRRVARAHGIDETRGDRLSRDKLRADYHTLLNRLVLAEAYKNLIKDAAHPPPPYKLMHLINTTLNLVGGDNLAWQQRKAEPFTVSPLHSGCFRLGYRESRNYGGSDTNGISVGTAAAISGAAASSNMGYYTTSPVISLLLTLFNVRLGWWLGNPGTRGRESYKDRAPRNSVMPVISEAFGMTDDRNEYVYLSDGGHFENLALYEMVLRRCHVIVCSDGAQDEHYRFGDLGNAVRKIRIDLGIPIEFTSVPIYAEPPDPKEGRGFYWAVGRVRYSCVDYNARDGVLIYLKPAVYGTEPRDVLEYKKSFPAFPHQSTGDQFFDEPQFESYRALGSHAMDTMCGEGTRALDIDELVRKSIRPLAWSEKKSPPPGPTLQSWLEQEEEEKVWLGDIVSRDWLAKNLPPDEP